MPLVRVSWYLVCLFLLLLLPVSAITILPGHEKEILIAQCALTAAAAAFASLAVLLRTRFRDHWVHRSKWILRFYMGFAALITMMAFVTTAG